MKKLERISENKYFWTVIRILGILLAIYLGLVSLKFLSYLYRPVTTSRMNVCGFYAEPENSLDVVYVGGSACYRYWEPLKAWKDYGFTSYNFATDAIQPQVIKYILEEIQKTQKPFLNFSALKILQKKIRLFFL